MNQNTSVETPEVSKIEDAAVKSSWNPITPDGSRKYEMIGNKPVLYVTSITVLTVKSTEFHHKLLCDGMTLNPGDACVSSCTFCYVSEITIKRLKGLLSAFNRETGLNLRLHDVVIRRRAPLDILRRQLIRPNGTRIYDDPDDQRVVYMSTLVDVAATVEILQETAEVCRMILENTGWHIRLLSKSPLLARLVTSEMIPKQYHDRLILGFSTGTLDDKLAASIEKGTGLVSKRIAALHKLQDLDIRTFAMICPSLPYATQEEYDEFSRSMCEALRVDRCEHVWAEVINVRGHSFIATAKALRDSGHVTEAERVEAVCGPGSKGRWEEYARMTFEAHKKHVPAAKLRFLQYISPATAGYWSGERASGAVLLGKSAEELGLLSSENSGAIVPYDELEVEDVQYHEERREIVTKALKSSLAAARALYEIKTYRDGILWKTSFSTFQDYCAKQWKYQSSHAYRLLALGRFLDQLPEQDSPFGENSQVRESHLRPILEKVPVELQVECWKGYVGTSEQSKPTAASVRLHVNQFLGEKGLTAEPAVIPKQLFRDKAKARISLLVADLAKLGIAEESKRPLGQVLALIDRAAERNGADEPVAYRPRG